MQQEIHPSTTGIFLSVSYVIVLEDVASQLNRAGSRFNIQVLGDTRGDGERVEDQGIFAVRITGGNDADLQNLFAAVSAAKEDTCLLRRTRADYFAQK